MKLTYNVADFYNGDQKLAQTNLRNVVGETELDEALTSREMINAKLRSVLDDATDKWGVRVVREDQAHRPAGRRHRRHAPADEGRARQARASRR